VFEFEDPILVIERGCNFDRVNGRKRLSDAEDGDREEGPEVVPALSHG
jgi:hypothetical protein